MRTGTVNSYPVICIADRKGNACSRDRIVVTLKRGTNANQVLSQLLDVRGRSNGKLVYLNVNQSFSYEDGETYFDMEQFLEAAP